MAQPTRHQANDLTLAVLLSTLLALVYLLTFSGQFRAVDEFAMYARTESLAQGKGLDTPQLAFSSLHSPVGELEPGQPLLAVPLYRIAQFLPGTSSIAAVMLLNVITTALTGGALFLLLRGMSFSQVVSAGTALAWGIGTTAWPYARSFFREPLLGLVWVSAAALTMAWRRKRRVGYALGCLALLCAGLAVKISSAAAIPVYLLALFWDPSCQRTHGGWKRLACFALAALVSGAAALLLYYLRYGYALPVAEFTWKYPWWDAASCAYGLLFSPVKGLIFYSPIILATAVGWAGLFRTHRRAALMVLGVSLSLLYVYGRAPEWHGGSVVWGPRFVVPLLPLLLLPYASALESRKALHRVWVTVCSAIGLVVQFTAGTASWSDAVWQMLPAYSGEKLMGIAGIPWYSWALALRSPALEQFTHWQPSRFDIMWLRRLADGTLASDGALALLLVVLTLAAVAALMAVLARPRVAQGRQPLFITGCLVLFLVGGSGLLYRSGRDTNDHYGLSRAEGQELADLISAPDGAPYSVVMVSNDFFVNYWLGLLKGRFVTQWHSPYDVAGFAGSVAAAPEAETIWLVIDRVHMPADVEPYHARHALANQAYEVGGRWVGGYEVFEYAPPRAMVSEMLERSWTKGIRILRYATDTRAVAQGEALRVDLEFDTTTSLEQDYALFLHLVRADGAVIAARDGEPQYGGAPTRSWEPGQTFTDRRGIRIPEDAQPGTYQLVCGWVNNEGDMLAPTEGEGSVLENKVVLGAIEVLQR
ncbi:MAG: hypothetical protein ACYC4R_11375 [Anaerolineae bacterium]